ncbi:MAG: DUF2769 domain-containing protein [Methanobacterium sp. ERen5]|nr:MAG: DUF2769 domain-containing protein [Methanobacterium sp. ERen5]
MIPLNKLEFSLENYEKCKCIKCPVQICSICTLEKQQEIESKIEANETDSSPSKIPGMYCVTGRSSCGDLNTKEICQCYRCQLWTEYDLLHGKPMRYFCSQGVSKPKK